MFTCHSARGLNADRHRKSLNELQSVGSGFEADFTIIGRTLRARTLPAQKVEARVGCKVLNRMTALGMPVSRRLA